MGKLNKNHYRLEYNQKQGLFHWDDGTHKENTFGWETVCSNLSLSQCEEFCGLIDEAYFKPLDKITKECGEQVLPFPTLNEMKQQFEYFLLT